MKKILALVPDRVDGCAYHRIEMPLHLLEGFERTQLNNLEDVKDSVLQDHDILWFNRLQCMVNHDKQLARLKNLGVKYVIDIDDYWQLPDGHLIQADYKHHEVPRKIIEFIKGAAAVITTHSLLADKIKPFNKNIVIAPNAIDPNQPQFTPTPSMEKTVFGWCGGAAHKQDLDLLKEGLKTARDNKMFLALAGYADNLVWNYFEHIFNGGRYDRYFRIDSADVYNYGYLYDHFTTALVPLKNNTFNNCKSELKLIEAGFKGKAAIVSEIMPYTIVPKDKCLWIKDGHASGWYKQMSKIQKSKQLEQELAGKLSEWARSERDLRKINKVRIDLFNTL